MDVAESNGTMALSNITTPGAGGGSMLNGTNGGNVGTGLGGVGGVGGGGGSGGNLPSLSHMDSKMMGAHTLNSLSSMHHLSPLNSNESSGVNRFVHSPNSLSPNILPSSSSSSSSLPPLPSSSLLSPQDLPPGSGGNES